MGWRGGSSGPRTCPGVGLVDPQAGEAWGSTHPPHSLRDERRYKRPSQGGGRKNLGGVRDKRAAVGPDSKRPRLASSFPHCMLMGSARPTRRATTACADAHLSEQLSRDSCAGQRSAGTFTVAQRVPPSVNPLCDHEGGGWWGTSVHECPCVPSLEIKIRDFSLRPLLKPYRAIAYRG